MNTEQIKFLPNQ